MLLDLKVLKATLQQIEEEKKIPQAALLDAIEQSLAAAYKKDLGKRGQIVKCQLDMESGATQFWQVKHVVDENAIRPALTDEEREAGVEEEEAKVEALAEGMEGEAPKPRFDEEKHIMIDDAKRIKSGVAVGDELTFPLEQPEADFGRIAAQTAKQVIIQRMREAERTSIMGQYADKQGQIITGIVQKVERGNVFIDFNRAVGVLPRAEQIPGEFFNMGDRIKAYLYQVEEGPRGINLRLSRSHPRLIESLFAMESPEVAGGTVEIKAIAREAGSRSKIAVVSNDENVDPIGSCVGQKGIRVTTVMSELHGEKIDIIKWSADTAEYISNSLSPAKPISVEISESEHIARVLVPDDKFSLAIGKGGENVRLAAKLTGWKIDIKSIAGEEVDADGNPIDKKAFNEVVQAIEEEAELTDADGNLDNNTEFTPSDEVAPETAPATDEEQAAA